MVLRTVRVPSELAEKFAEAEKLVSDAFGRRVDDPARASIEIFGERYVLVRAASLSVEFFALVRDLYGAGRAPEADAFALNILFDLAHSIGKSDAKRIHERLGLVDPISRLTAGPIHFSHAGWAFVDIHEESQPVPGDGFQLVYDHPHSFEATAWLQAERPAAFPICIMNAGYSSGWCEESFELPLVASEVLCRARGDDACRFIMAPPEKIEELIARYKESRPRLAGRMDGHQIPDFFARKRMEEELRRARDELERRVHERTADLSRANERLLQEASQRARAETQLLQAARLEAVGRLAGGIAHDFNNLMGVVIGHASILERRMDQDDPVRAQLVEIRKAGEHAAALTQQLLAFSRSQRPHPELLDANDVLDEVGGMLRRLIPEDVELEIVLGTHLGHVRMDRTQLGQVVMNLALNARDAMPEGGRLVVRTGRVRVTDETPLEEHDVSPGDWVMLEVIDTGVGMTDEVLAHAFDPFFTTKAAGSGTGLGLPTVYNIVDGVGGSTSVSTAPNAGARFRVYLPHARDDAPDAVQVAPSSSEEAPPNSPTILVVEDQAALRRMVTGLLENLGYRVCAASNAEEAIAVAESQAPIGLLLTDVVMPRMSGRELADRLAQTRPGLRVLYMSGYNDDEVLRYGVEEGNADLLPKPFTPEELAERVRAALER